LVFEESGMGGEGLLGPEVLLISGDPVRRDVALRDGKIETAFTDQLIEVVFQSVFGVSVPSHRTIRLGPQVADVGGAA
jgi:hypothetical protein